MKSTQNSEETQEVPQKTNFTRAELEERILSAQVELYLDLRRTVIEAFLEYGKMKKRTFSHLMSNVLLDMDEMFRFRTRGEDV